ncbi:MAG: F0F1 ATP synthase subunit delta [Bacteriovoracaceae bacterium]
MKDRIIARAYAKSLIELGEQQKLDIVKEITDFSELISSSNQLENLLFLDVFTIDEKKAVLIDIFNKAQYSNLLKNFIFMIMDEKRLSLFPQIFKETVVIEDDRKGFLKGTIEGAETQLDPAVLEKIKKFLEEKIKRKPFLTYIQNGNISAGYKITAEDLQLDATLENQLEQLRENILSH